MTKLKVFLNAQTENKKILIPFLFLTLSQPIRLLYAFNALH